MQSRKPYKTLWKSAFHQNGKRIVKTLIKPVVYEDFWVPFPQKWQKVSKSIRFVSKKEYEFAESRNLIKPCKMSILPKRKTHCENPYKTCRLWRLLGAISAKVTQNNQKSIRFISKKECDFAESKNIIKPCEDQHFTRTENALWKPL